MVGAIAQKHLYKQPPYNIDMFLINIQKDHNRHIFSKEDKEAFMLNHRKYALWDMCTS